MTPVAQFNQSRIILCGLAGIFALGVAIWLFSTGGDDWVGKRSWGAAFIGSLFYVAMAGYYGYLLIRWKRPAISIEGGNLVAFGAAPIRIADIDNITQSAKQAVSDRFGLVIYLKDGAIRRVPTFLIQGGRGDICKAVRLAVGLSEKPLGLLS